MEDKKLLQLVSDIGFDMLSYGGEIYRVEETVKRICFAYGIEIVDVLRFLLPLLFRSPARKKHTAEPDGLFPKVLIWTR